MGSNKKIKSMVRRITKLTERFIRWFTISRGIVTIWNIIALFYHCIWIGIPIWTSLIIQSTALIMEYLLCGWYEHMLLWSNKKINATILFIFARVITKYIIFTSIFVCIYVSTYYLRLEFFYLIDFGINIHQLEKSINNMVIFSLIMGPLMGTIVIARKKRTIHH